MLKRRNFSLHTHQNLFNNKHRRIQEKGLISSIQSSPNSKNPTKILVPSPLPNNVCPIKSKSFVFTSVFKFHTLSLSSSPSPAKSNLKPLIPTDQKLDLNNKTQLLIKSYSPSPTETNERNSNMSFYSTLKKPSIKYVKQSEYSPMSINKYKTHSLGLKYKTMNKLKPLYLPFSFPVSKKIESATLKKMLISQKYVKKTNC